MINSMEEIGWYFCKRLGYSYVSIGSFMLAVSDLNFPEVERLNICFNPNRLELKGFYKGKGDFAEWKNRAYDEIEAITGYKTFCEISFNRKELEGKRSLSTDPKVLYMRYVSLPNSETPFNVSFEDKNQ